MTPFDTNKQAIAECWARGATAPQIAEALGVSHQFVCLTLQLLHVRDDRWGSTTEFLATMAREQPTFEACVRALRLRNSTRAQAGDSKAA
jgi:predicted nucleotidyltransferase